MVVILPDSGDRYLSKFYDDNWMRENGYLPAARSEDNVARLLEFRKKIPLVTARSEDRITTVVEKMKSFDISQLPVVDFSR